MHEFTDTKEQLKRKAQENVEQICQELLPAGKKQCGSWLVGDITGTAGKSMSVNLTGEKAGLWYDHATKEGGDIFALWAMNKGISFMQAFDEMCARFNVSRVMSVARERKPKPYSKKGIQPLRTSPAMDYMHSRGIKEPTLMAYNIRSHKSGQVRMDKDGDHPDYLFSKNTDYWVAQYSDSVGDRTFLKSFGIAKDSDGKHDIWSTQPYYSLWGWWTVRPNHEKVIITEGEIDCMSVYQMLGDPSIPVLSVPNGATSLTWINNDYDALSQFKTIYIMFDTDKPDRRGKCPGEEGARAVAERLGLARCFRVNVPPGFKDPNDVLCNGKQSQQDVHEWLKAASTYDPPTMRSVTAFRDEVKDKRRKRLQVIEHAKFTFDVPFVQMPGELTVLQGYPGSGKSDITYQIAGDELERGEKVLICTFEIPEDEMIEILATQYWRKVPTDDELDHYIDQVADQLWFVREGELKVTPKGLFNDIEYACRRFSVTKVYIDSLHFVVAKGDWEGQDDFIRDLTRLMKRLPDAHCTLIAHSRFGENSDHRIPRIDDVEGSKGMLKPVQNILTMWRNTPKEDAKQDPDSIVKHDGSPDDEKYARLMAQPDAYLVCYKQRNGHRRRFKQGFWFDFRSRRFRTELLATETSRDFTQQEISTNKLDDDGDPF